MNALEEFDKLYTKASSADAQDFSVLLRDTPIRGDDEAYMSLLKQYPSLLLETVPPYLFPAISNLIMKNYPEEEFYEKLRSIIFDSPVLASDSERQLAFLLAIMNELLPYEHVDVISMDEDEYSERKERLSKQLSKISHLANRPFSQKTENASALMDVIDPIEDKRDRAVLLAAVIDAFQPQQQ